MSKLRALLLVSTFIPLAACNVGADDVASPGEGGIIVIPGPSPTPPPPTTPPTTPPPTGGPAASCPANTTDRGVGQNGLPSNVRNCEISGTITGDRLIQDLAGVVYSLAGRVQVGTDCGSDPAAPIAGCSTGRLTIDPGTVIFGSGGLDLLVVNRGSQIFAEGTQTNPIIFTSRQNIIGSAGANSTGQFGGLVILGRAPIFTSQCTGIGGAPAGGSVQCQGQVEGTTGFFGGATAADNSGALRYVQVRFPGFEVSTGNELNGITLAGVGRGTVLDRVQVHNSSDDGIEWFGGTVNSRYLVITGADDDGLDLDQGYRGANQFQIVLQRTTGGDKLFEVDSPGNANLTPRTFPVFVNGTYVDRTSGNDAFNLRGGADFAMINSVITGPTNCFDIDDGVITMQPANPALQEAGPPIFRSVFASCPTLARDEADVTAVQFQAIFTGNNNAVGANSLVSLFVNGANENAVTATNPSSVSGLPITPSNFITNVGYIGAVRDNGDQWFVGWTCGLGFGTPACETSPTA